jgi:hypothetical protein
MGEPGELFVRGHCIFVGFWNQQKQADEVLDKNRWYHTGYQFMTHKISLSLSLSLSSRLFLLILIKIILLLIFCVIKEKICITFLYDII